MGSACTPFSNEKEQSAVARGHGDGRRGPAREKPDPWEPRAGSFQIHKTTRSGKSKAGNSVTGGLGLGGEWPRPGGTGLSFRGDKNLIETDCGDGCTIKDAKTY